jgi:hypothetical protein
VFPLSALRLLLCFDFPFGLRLRTASPTGLVVFFRRRLAVIAVRGLITGIYCTGKIYLEWKLLDSLAQLGSVGIRDSVNLIILGMNLEALFSLL